MCSITHVALLKIRLTLFLLCVNHLIGLVIFLKNPLHVPCETPTTIVALYPCHVHIVAEQHFCCGWLGVLHRFLRVYRVKDVCFILIGHTIRISCQKIRTCVGSIDISTDLFEPRQFALYPQVLADS